MNEGNEKKNNVNKENIKKKFLIVFSIFKKFLKKFPLVL